MTTFRWSFEEDVSRYRDAGIDGIGIWRQKLADYGEDKGIALVERSGLKTSNLLWAGGFTGSDGHSHQESLHDAREALRLAAALSADCLVVYSGARNGHTHSHARRLFCDALRELAPLAEELGVSIGIEPMHARCAEDWSLLTTADEVVSLIEALESPSLKLVYDTYHLGHEEGVLDTIARVGHHVGMVHLGDSMHPPDAEQNRCPLGEGILPLRPIGQALRESGYDGFYDVELLGEEIERCDYQDLLVKTRQTFERLLADCVRP